MKKEPSVINPFPLPPSLDNTEEIERRQLQQKILQQVRIKPYYWLANFVYTLDPDSSQPNRQFPQHGFFQEIVKKWLSERILFVAKSSQQMATWLFVALHLWDAMYHPGKFVIFQSSKESKAGFGGGDSKSSVQRGNPLTLLGRADYIYNNLPKFLQTPRTISKEPPTMKFTFYEKGKETYSIILGVSSSKDEARQWTITNALIDEAAFQPFFSESLTALMPRLTRNARMTVVSTPNGKDEFYARIYDRL